MPAKSQSERQQIQQTFDFIARQVAVCPRCPELVENRTQPVFADGPPEAEMLFLGEAPGRREDEQGVPFVGAAGKKLDELLAAVGLRRDDVYITNAVKCRPPKNRKPRPEEIANCRGYFERQVEALHPRVICLLGATAVQSVLESKQSLGKLRRQVHDYHGIPVIVTYHPAYVVRMPQVRRKFLSDLRLVRRQLD